MLQVSIKDTFAWTDSNIVLNWLKGSPKRLKTYVCNRVSYIVETIPNTSWFQVNGADNPVDCASRGMFPSELLDHELWWKGPAWFNMSEEHWPRSKDLPPNQYEEECTEICLHTSLLIKSPVIPIDRYSNFNHKKRITVWILRYIRNSLSSRGKERCS